MKNYYTILWFFLFSITLYSQNNIEEFKSIVDSTTNQQIKLQYLDSILKNISNEDAENYVPYSVQFIDLAEELEEYEKMANETVKVFYPLNSIQNKKDVALKLLENAQKYEDKIKDSFLLGSIYLKKGGAYFGNDFEKAIESYSNAILKFSTKDTIKIADSYLFRAQAKSYKSDYVGAINDYEIAARYYENLKNAEYLVYAKSGIAIIFSMNNIFDKAKKMRDEVIDFAKQNDQPYTIVTELINQSIDYRKQGLYDLQKNVLLEANKINSDDKVYDSFNDIVINGSLTRLYTQNGDVEKTTYHFKKIEHLKNEISEVDYITAFYYMAEANYLFANKKYTEAIGTLKKSINTFKEAGDKDSEVLIKEYLIEFYEKINDTDNAYLAQREFIRLKDSMFTVQKTNTLMYYQALYDTEKKERELIEKNSSIELLEKDNQAKKRLLFFSIGGLLLFFLSVFLYRNKQHLKKEKELQENYSQQLLASQEDERKRISKDLHDGLGQSLLLIKNKVVLTNNDESTKDMFNDAIEEVRSISRALHPFQLEKFGITKAIENIIRELDESSEMFISSEMEDITGILSPDKEVNLYRIVQESLSNIIKHSNAEAARIEIQKKPKYIHLKIKDNGKGFDFSEKHNDFKSLGLKTLKERTKFLKGTMKIDSEKNKGTTLEFVIPV